MALKGDGDHFVLLDKSFKTMRDTGRDMKDEYKEAARGGLAVRASVIEMAKRGAFRPPPASQASGEWVFSECRFYQVRCFTAILV